MKIGRHQNDIFRVLSGNAFDGDAWQAVVQVRITGFRVHLWCGCTSIRGRCNLKLWFSTERSLLFLVFNWGCDRVSNLKLHDKVIHPLVFIRRQNFNPASLWKSVGIRSDSNFFLQTTSTLILIDIPSFKLDSERFHTWKVDVSNLKKIKNKMRALPAHFHCFSFSSNSKHLFYVRRHSEPSLNQVLSIKINVDVVWKQNWLSELISILFQRLTGFFQPGSKRFETVHQLSFHEIYHSTDQHDHSIPFFKRI